MSTPDSALGATLAAAREHLDTILDRGRLHYADIAPAADPVDEPSGAGAPAAPARVDLTLVRRAALFERFVRIAQHLLFGDFDQAFFFERGYAARKIRV